MNDYKIVSLTPETFAQYGACGYKDIEKHRELKAKLDWFTSYYPKGLRIQLVISAMGGNQGMIEYIPGALAHRPVHAKDFMFIHCLFAGFRNEYKGKGFASALLATCERDAEALHMKGIAVVTRKGSFMANRNIFVKNGFETVELAKPDFELLVKKFGQTTENPYFNTQVLNSYEQYGTGLTIFRSPQCPYTEKNVRAMLETAEMKFGIQTQLIDLKDHQMAQKTPSPFGTFAMICNGKIISHHPISNTRFENIMQGLKPSLQK